MGTGLGDRCRVPQGRSSRLNDQFEKSRQGPAAGEPLSYRNLTRQALALPLARSGVARLRWHDMRDTFASILIAQGLDVVYVSRQMGHASPSITLSLYAGLFDQQRHAERAKAAVEERFGAVLAAGGGNVVPLRVPRVIEPCSS